jgi:carboxypeptidase Taq
MANQAYGQLLALAKEFTVFESVSALLGWDQETTMPKGGTEARAEQRAVMSGLIHDKRTSKEFGDLLTQCEEAAFADDSVEAANIREWRRHYDRDRKLPKAHVEEFTRVTSLAQPVWAEARKESDFSKFAPSLKTVLELTRKSAEYYGYPNDGEPYDALLEGYEPYASTKAVEEVFVPLRERLSSFLREIADAPQRPDDSVHKRVIPQDQQLKFVKFVIKNLGFRFEEGRVDTSTHPFCSGITPGDVRLTTRFHDDNVMDALSSTMHESGHGMYEQNLNREWWGTPCGYSVSLGIHESQSRGWENQVGRNRAFWEWCLPHAKEIMPEALADQTVDSIYAAQNIVRPSYIRVEADEATYNLHIMLRFEIERAMIRGEIDVDEIPNAWNTRFKDYLGIDVDKDANGCLQDVHWSFGLMGYFPTYSLGNLYCAQFFEAAYNAMPDLDDQFRKGEFRSLLNWLTENIHRHGSRYPAGELCKRVTGKPLSSEPLLSYLEKKLRPIYGIG